MKLKKHYNKISQQFLNYKPKKDLFKDILRETLKKLVTAWKTPCQIKKHSLAVGNGWFNYILWHFDLDNSMKMMKPIANLISSR